MMRFIEVETRRREGVAPDARLVGPTLPPKFWWWGGTSWAGKIEGPLLVEVAATPGTLNERLTDFFRTTNARIVSARLKEVLRQAGAEVEFWPATILLGQEVIQEKFFAVNSLVRRRAVDLDRSKIELDDEFGDALSVEKLVLDEQKLQDVKWAVVEEVNRIAVDEQIQHAISLAGCTGCRFMDPIEIRY